jgi:hypothetical protein
MHVACFTAWESEMLDGTHVLRSGASSRADARIDEHETGREG